jgi:hypothetical protein
VRCNPAEINKELVQLIGGAARKEDELLHTSLASSIVHQYLRLLAGDSREGPATVAYFDHARKTVVMTRRIGGGRSRAK